LENEISRPRGRPFGHRLSDCTKEKIRQSRIGKKHSEATKNKISRSLLIYFRKKNSLAESIEHEYSYISEEATDWISENREEIDAKLDSSVLTDKRMYYMNQIELNFGSEIEYLFGHNMTPEFLVMIKERLSDVEDLDEFKSIL